MAILPHVCYLSSNSTAIQEPFTVHFLILHNPAIYNINLSTSSPSPMFYFGLGAADSYLMVEAGQFVLGVNVLSVT